MKFWTYQTLILSVLLVSFSFGQQETISGTVVDSTTNQPIAHVNVFILGSTVGSIADQSGVYSLALEPKAPDDQVIIFKHVAYEEKRMTVGALKTHTKVKLVSSIIQFDKIDIESKTYHSVLDEGITNTKKIFTYKELEVRAIKDVSDLLKYDPSIQISESTSGGKYISLRGSNVNDITVLFNGIRINSNYDGSYDASLLDPDQINQIEIIKGGNLILYGNQGIAGVVNILPKFKREYNAKFSQRFGSNNMGAWSAIGGGSYRGADLYGTYSKAASRSNIINTSFDSLEIDLLSQSSTKHLEGSVLLPLGDKFLKMEVYLNDGRVKYENKANAESVEKNKSLSFINMSGIVFRGLFMRAGYSLGQAINTDKYNFYSHQYRRNIHELDHQINISADLETDIGIFYTSYQNTQSHFSIEDFSTVELSGINQRDLELARSLTGYGIQFRSYDNSKKSNETILIDLGFRKDVARDKIIKDDCFNCTDISPPLTGGYWNVPSLKSALFYQKVEPQYDLSVFTSYGINKRFPYVLEAISQPVLSLQEERTSSIEYGRTFDIGFSVKNSSSMNNVTISSWEVSSSYFWNHFSNKHVLITAFGVPLRSYMLIPDVSIKGVESNIEIGLLDERLFFKSSINKNYITDLSVFPFKPEYKITNSILFNTKLFGIILENVVEGKKESWLRNPEGQLTTQELDAWNNYDMHLTFDAHLMSLKGRVSLSYYNILEKTFQIQGLSYYQQRLMLSFNVEV